MRVGRDKFDEVGNSGHGRDPVCLDFSAKPLDSMIIFAPLFPLPVAVRGNPRLRASPFRYPRGRRGGLISPHGPGRGGILRRQEKAPSHPTEETIRRTGAARTGRRGKLEWFEFWSVIRLCSVDTPFSVCLKGTSVKIKLSKRSRMVR